MNDVEPASPSEALPVHAAAPSIRMARPWRRAMLARDPGEHHRAATPLELLFDLCFVVAISQVALRFHHALSADHVVSAIPAFAMVFFAIWWAWMNFTWFASAYDTDDVPYRLKVLLQIAGVLVLAAGVGPAFDHGDFLLVTVGYTVMRVALVAQWLRAARADVARRITARRYALGLTLVQLGWVVAILVPHAWWLYLAMLLVPLELVVPIWAERAAPTTWHPHHIAERYGLLTLIVLGESVLAATVAIQDALGANGLTLELVAFLVGSLLTFFSMWWIYFDVPAGEHLEKNRNEAFLWGYGHIVVFAVTAAVGAGIAFLAEGLGGGATGESAHGGMLSLFEHHASPLDGLALGVPVALFTMSVWVLHIRPHRCGRGSQSRLRQPWRGWLIAYVAAAALAIVASLLPCSVLAVGLVMASLTAFTIISSARGARAD